jgi:peptidoglycan hydrolase-like protein with peptidoglycan-binding domain
MWWFSKKQKINKNSTGGKVSTENNFTEESVLKIQTEFENKLFYNYAPDAISGKEIYIYKNLMVPWFNNLTLKMN